MAINQNDYTPETWEAGSYLYAKQMTEISATIDKIEEYVKAKFAGFDKAEDTVESVALEIAKQIVAEQTADLVSNEAMTAYVIAAVMKAVDECQVYTNTEVADLGKQLQHKIDILNANKADAATVHSINAIVNKHETDIAQLQSDKADKTEVVAVGERLAGVSGRVGQLEAQATIFAKQEDLAKVKSDLEAADAVLNGHISQADTKLAAHEVELAAINTKCADIEQSITDLGSQIGADFATKAELETEKSRIGEAEQKIIQHTSEITQIKATCNSNFTHVSDTLKALGDKDKAIDEQLATKATVADLNEAIGRVQELEQKTAGYDLDGSASDYIKAEVDKIIDAAPEELNTLREIADALGDSIQSSKDQIAAVEGAISASRDITEKLMARHDSELLVVNDRLGVLETGLQTDVENMTALTVRVDTAESDVVGLKQADTEIREFFTEEVARVEGSVAALSDQHTLELQAAKAECASNLAASVDTLRQENEATDIAVRTEITAQVAALNASIATKADQTVVTQLAEEVASNKSGAEQVAGDLAARIEQLENKHDEELKAEVDKHAADIDALTKKHNELGERIKINATNLTNFKQHVEDQHQFAQQAHDVLTRDVLDRAKTAYVDAQDQAILAVVDTKASKEELQQGLNACVSKLEYEARIPTIEANIAANRTSIEKHAQHLGGLDVLVDTKADEEFVATRFAQVDTALNTKADKSAIEKMMVDGDAALGDRIDQLKAACEASDKQLTAQLNTTNETAAALAEVVEGNKAFAASEVTRLEQAIATKADDAAVNERATAIETNVAELNRLLSGLEKPVRDELNEKVQAAVNGLVDGAPDMLNTLKEISDAIQSSDSNAVDLLAKIEANKKDCEAQFTGHGNRLVALETSSKTFATQADLNIQSGRIDTINASLVGKVDTSALQAVENQVAELRNKDTEFNGALATLQMRVANHEENVNTKFGSYVTTEALNNTLQTQYMTSAQVRSEVATSSNALNDKITKNVEDIVKLSDTVDSKVKSVEDRVVVLEKYDNEANLKHQELSSKIDTKVAELSAAHLVDINTLMVEITRVETECDKAIAAEISERKQSDADLRVYVDNQFATTNNQVEKVVGDVEQLKSTAVTKDQFDSAVGGIVTEANIDSKVAAAVAVVNDRLTEVERANAAKHVELDNAIKTAQSDVAALEIKDATLVAEDARLEAAKADRSEVQAVSGRTTTLESKVEALQTQVGTASVEEAVNKAVADLIGTAPETLDTLGELVVEFGKQDDKVQTILESVNKHGDQLVDHNNRMIAVEKSVEDVAQIYSTKAELAAQSERLGKVEGQITNVASGKADVTEVIAIEHRVDALEDKDRAHAVLFDTLTSAHAADKATLEAADQALDAKVEQYKQQSDAKHVEIDQAIEDVQTELQLGIDAHVADFEEHKQSVQDSFELVQGRLEALENYDVDAEAEHEAIRQEIADKIAAEEVTRSSMDATLQRSIEQEVAARETEIAIINQAIADHETDSTNKINQIKVDIVNINGQLATVDTKIADAVSAHDAEVEQLVQEKVEQHVADFGQVSDEVARLEQEKATKEALAAEVAKLTDAINSTDTTLTETKDHLTNLSKNFEVYHGVHEEKIAALEDKDVEYRNELDQLFETTRTNVSDIDMIRYSFSEHLETANAKFDKKADKVDVEEGLNSKADLTVFSEFKQQAEEHHAEMVADIATKASKEELAAVDAKFASKVDASVFETFKLDAEQKHSTIEAELVKKADKVEIERKLTEEVNAAVTALIGGNDETLDTLAELVAAFQKDDATLNDTLNTAITKNANNIANLEAAFNEHVETVTTELETKADKADVKAGLDSKANLIDFNAFKKEAEEKHADIEEVVAAKVAVADFEQFKSEAATEHAALEAAIEAAKAEIVAGDKLKADLNALNSHVIDFNQFKSMYEDMIAEMKTEIAQLRNYVRELQGKVEGAEQLKDTTPVVLESVFSTDMVAQSNSATKKVVGNLTIECGMLMNQSDDETKETTYNFVSNVGDVTIGDMTVSDSILNVTAGPTLDQINADQDYNDATTVVKKVTAETMPSKSNVDGNGNWTSSQATKIVENDLVVDGGALTRQDEVETHETTYNFKSTSGSATFNNITVDDSIMNVTAGPALGA